MAAAVACGDVQVQGNVPDCTDTGCPSGERCVDRECVRDADGGDGASGDDAGGELLAFVDDEAADFGAGAMDGVEYVGDRLQLQPDILVGGLSSRVFDADGEARWTSLRWRPAHPYGKPLPGNGESDQGYESPPFEMAGNVLLLHFDEAGPLLSGDVFADASGRSNQARLLIVDEGDPKTVEAVNTVRGVFGSAFEDTLESSLEISGDSADLQFGTGDFTWSMWINANRPCHESNSNDAYMGGEELNFQKTHIWMGCARSSQPFCDPAGPANGRPTATICTDFGANDCVRLCGGSDLPDGRWHHLAMRKTGHPDTTLDLWFDGKVEATGSATLVSEVAFIDGGDFGIGHFWIRRQSDSDAQGLLDEAAIFRRALTDEELLALYHRSVVRLRFQARVCAEPDCVDDPEFAGPDGSAGSFYEDSTAAPAETPIPLQGLGTGRYFQYRVAFETVANGPNPQLLRVEITAEK